jgi:hypothetical protein
MLKHVKRVMPVLGAVLLAAGSILPVSTARADQLLVESFTNAAVANPADWVSGGSGPSISGWPGVACLTAGTNTSQTPVAGCGLGSPDAAGSGALRLSPDNTGSAGFALNNNALPTSGGLDITFDQAQYGGSGADGIAFFIVDGSADLTQPGASGGGLGYTSGGGVTPGVTHGLLGIGIDKWGNFSAPTSSGTGCAAGTGVGSQGPGQTPNVVSIRGEGDGTTGYCWLANSADLGTTLSGASRSEATVQVHIVIDPSTVATRHVTVSLDGTQVLQIPAPDALLAATSFKFGFAGSTGAVTDIHEVWNLTINSVIPVVTTTTSTTAAPSTTEATTSTTVAPVAAQPSFTG